MYVFILDKTEVALAYDLLRVQWKLSRTDTLHPNAKNVSEAGAGRLQECRNTEFVGELRKMAFCEGGHN